MCDIKIHRIPSLTLAYTHSRVRRRSQVYNFIVVVCEQKHRTFGRALAMRSTVQISCRRYNEMYTDWFSWKFIRCYQRNEQIQQKEDGVAVSHSKWPPMAVSVHFHCAENAVSVASTLTSVLFHSMWKKENSVSQPCFSRFAERRNRDGVNSYTRIHVRHTCSCALSMLPSQARRTNYTLYAPEALSCVSRFLRICGRRQCVRTFCVREFSITHGIARVCRC